LKFLGQIGFGKGSKMILETKFALDQKVSAISNTNYSDVILECAICDRTGRVTLKGENLVCPKCHGQSVLPRWFIEIARGVVVQFDVRRTVVRLAGSDRYQNANSYMLDVIGSGRIWPEDHLFASVQEAEDECAKRNDGA
jgi:hypothetical protein